MFLNCLPQTLKTENPEAAARTQVIITDKDFGERQVFREVLPHVNLQLCLFHVLKVFRKEIPEKDKLTSDQKQTILKHLDALAQATSPSNFEELYNFFLVDATPNVISYIEKNWLPIKNEWVSCFKNKVFNLGETTNNRAEAFFGHFKEIVDRHHTVAEMLTGLLNHISFLRREKRRQFLSHDVKVPVNQTVDPNLLDYFVYCTPRVFKRIEKEFHKVSDFFDQSTFVNNTVSYYGKTYTISNDTCTCQFFTSHNLPCKHMFALAKHNNSPSYFFQNAIHPRFRKDKYRQLYGLSPDIASTIQTNLATKKTPAPLDSSQKYKIVSSELSIITNNLIFLGQHEFSYYLELIKQLSSFIKDKKKAFLCEIVEASEADFNAIQLNSADADANAKRMESLIFLTLPVLSYTTIQTSVHPTLVFSETFKENVDYSF